MKARIEAIARTDELALERVAAPGGWVYVATTASGSVALTFVRDHERDWPSPGPTSQAEVPA